MLVTVTANPAIHRILLVRRLTPGTVHRASQVTLQAGGKGLNVARLEGHGWREAARLGLACAAAHCRTPLPGRFDPAWARAAARQVP